MKLEFHKLTLIVLIGVSFLFAACKSKKEEVKQKQILPEVQQVSLHQLQERIKANAGKVTVVNFWASWCTPCKEEMPYLIKLKNNYQDKLELLLVAIDDMTIVDSTIHPFLQTAGVDFLSFIKEEGDDEAFINAVNPEWSGALPATFIYDKNGNQVKMLIGEQTYERFEIAIKKILTSK
ncbi:MAG: TlpA family protein disulfide reductase [Ignavibacteriales bacterium]|nr:TlpA family protein disulfide reductase [Ignavibacteriales bacterium]